MTETLKKIIRLIQTEREPVTETLIHNPVIGTGKEDFRWQCGYAAGLSRAAELIEQLIQNGDNENEW